MSDLINTERILIIQLEDGRRKRYIPPKRGKWELLPDQIKIARQIGAKPLYCITIHPKPGHDWVLNSQLVRGS